MKKFIEEHTPIIVGTGMIIVAGVAAYCGVQLGIKNLKIELLLQAIDGTTKIIK